MPLRSWGCCDARLLVFPVRLTSRQFRLAKRPMLKCPVLALGRQWEVDLLGLVPVCLFCVVPALAPAQRAWARLEHGKLAVALSYYSLDQPLPKIRYLSGLVLWQHFTLEEVRAYRKDGTTLSANELRAMLDPASKPVFVGFDVVVSVWLIPPSDRLLHVTDDMLVIVLPRPIVTGIGF